MQITVSALKTAPELRGLAHDLQEVAERPDFPADTLQYSEPGDGSVDEIYPDLVEAAEETRVVLAGVQDVADTISYPA